MRTAFAGLLLAILSATVSANAAVTQPDGTVVPGPSSVTTETSLASFFSSRSEAIDWKADARTTPDTFAPLCGFTAEFVLNEAGEKRGLAWYNVTTTAPTSADLKTIIPAGAAVGTKITGADIVKDPAYKGGLIGFAIVGGQLHFSERKWNVVCTSCSPAAPWVTALTYQSSKTANAYYIGFEDGAVDSYSFNNDGDYNDDVFFLTGLQCPGAGTKCDTGKKGLCALGANSCEDGKLVCKEAVGPGAKKCNGLDNDCDGVIDDGPCPTGTVCTRGACMPECGTGEFKCPGSFVCDKGICVDPPCVGKVCGDGETCAKGECVDSCAGVVCPAGQFCTGGVCIDPCAFLKCGAGEVCDQGLCKPDCACAPCSGGRACDPGSKKCVTPACVGKTCDAGKFCSPTTGMCEDACSGAICPKGQVCTAGNCVATPVTGDDDAGVSFDAGPASDDATVSSDSGSKDPFMPTADQPAQPSCQCSAPAGARAPSPGTLALLALTIAFARRRARYAAIAALTLGCSSKEEPAAVPAADSAVVVEDVAPEVGPSPWKAGPYGVAPRDVAGPFVVPTTAGDWAFEQKFTGQDNYLFVVYRSTVAYSKGLFKTAALQKLLASSPANTHYFFLYRDGKAEFDAFADSASAVIPEEWRERVHFVTKPTTEIDGWLGDILRDPARTSWDALHFAVDRTQHVREVGMLGRLGSGGTTPDLSFLSAEPTYFEWEHALEERLAGQKATVVELFKDKTVVDEVYADVELPALSSFDTLEVDLTMNCENHRNSSCGAWDYISDLRLCTEGDDGGPPKCDTEIARWITSYWREGRWVTDISGMLAHLGDGGKKKLRWWASKQWDPRPANYVVSASLRFSNRGKGMRPFEARKLYEDAPLDATYNDKHPPLDVAIPAGTKKTELYALITGHGAETNSCAEFCNHTHHFTLNGGKKFSLEFPVAQSIDGCRKRVNEGVIPNQHGTWYFGRGGWCPGLDVPAFIADMTADAKPGMTNTLTYQALVGTTPPAADSKYGNIHQTTYLVFWR